MTWPLKYSNAEGPESFEGRCATIFDGRPLALIYFCDVGQRKIKEGQIEILEISVSSVSVKTMEGLIFELSQNNSMLYDTVLRMPSMSIGFQFYSSIFLDLDANIMPMSIQYKMILSSVYHRMPLMLIPTSTI